MRKIIVTIGKDGGATFKTEGFTGSSCKAATDAAEKALGKKVKDSNTPEFYKQGESNQQRLGHS